MAEIGKVYVTILCGAGDRPIARLGGCTPLEFAHTPHLDGLARSGALAQLTVIDETITPESDSGAMALLGYDPLVHYTGRGALEGLGMGFVDGGRPAVAFRVNFASRNATSEELDRRTARDLSDPELQQLADELRSQVKVVGAAFELNAFGRHRGILCFHSDSLPLSGNVTNTDPGFDKIGAFGVPAADHRGKPSLCVPLDDTDAAANTARLVEEFTRESSRILEASTVNGERRRKGKLPANVILFRDGGHELPELEGFTERTGMTMSLYGQVPAEHGLCKLIGGRFVDSKPSPGQDEAAFYRDLAQTLPEDPADVVLVHLKGADEPGHDNQPLGKAEALERIDRYYVGALAELAGDEDLVVFTGDHTTPCELGIHSADPVPTLANGPGVVPDDCARFSEREAAMGGLPIERAVELLPFLAGARTGP